MSERNLLTVVQLEVLSRIISYQNLESVNIDTLNFITCRKKRKLIAIIAGKMKEIKEIVECYPEFLGKEESNQNGFVYSNNKRKFYKRKGILDNEF